MLLVGIDMMIDKIRSRFQRAPTLGGECYQLPQRLPDCAPEPFQRAPTLGGECYIVIIGSTREPADILSTGTHPWG